MSALARAIAGARWFALGVFRYGMLVLAFLGVLGLVGSILAGKNPLLAIAILAIPGVYFGRFIYRGYQNTE